MSNRLSSPERVSQDGVDAVQADWSRERPDIDVRSIGVVTRIWRVGRYLDRVRNDRLATWETDRATIDILAMLRRAGSPYRQSAGQLTKHALITSGGVSQRLDKLERAGLITRHLDVNDRRRVDVELTAAGMKLIDSVLADVLHVDNELLDEVFSEEELETLCTLLRKFLLHFEPAVSVRD